jgi:hypothetical protein
MKEQRMRKAAGMLAALSLVIPAGILVTAPAGAATPTTKCKKLVGVQHFNPALPKIGSTQQVTSKTTATATISGCVGGGVTSGKVVTTPGKYHGNCQTLVFAKKGTVTKGTAKITWNNKKTSNVATTLTSLSAPGTASPKLKLVTKFVKGLFAGHTSTTTITATAPKGSCTSTGLKQFNFKNTSPITSK